MSQNALTVLLNILNAALVELNKAGYHVFDVENPEYYITTVEYRSKKDKLYFNVKELDKHVKGNG